MLTLWALLASNVFAPSIPRTWTDAAVRKLQVPLVNEREAPVPITEAEYYALPVRPRFRSYPVYHPSREPAGYREWLKQQEPQPLVDFAKLRTKEDWVGAGAEIFNAPASFGAVFFSADDLRDAAFFEATGMPVAGDGTIPFARWVVRRKGEVELGSMGCNTCHTRVLPDGRVVAGAQGNNPGDRQGARLMRLGAQAMGPARMLERLRQFALQFETPWAREDPNRAPREWSVDAFIAAGEAIPAGVTARSHTSLVLPPQIPDVIGVRERQYLDHTGLVRHREIGDLMRYVALVQDAIQLMRPRGAPAMPRQGARSSDEELYALALYLYSLQPPANTAVDRNLVPAGRRVFEREGCGSCHAAPLYTNNKLIPVDGFTPTAEDRRRLDIAERRIGTDPRYALQTQKGTGYYKVPSLKGLWYREPLSHNGAVRTLEDWLDADRLRADYVPTGYRGPDGAARGVPGHEFGLRVTAAEKKALIAFLRSL